MKKPRASSALTSARASLVASKRASSVLAFDFLIRFFTFEKASSMGLRSGE